MRPIEALRRQVTDPGWLARAFHELLYWVPALLVALLNRVIGPLQYVPMLWSPDWHNARQNPDDLALWLAVLSWPVLVMLKRDRMIRKGDLWALSCIVLVLLLAVVCVVLHAFFSSSNVQPPWYETLEALWEISYVAMIVAACFTVISIFYSCSAPRAQGRERTECPRQVLRKPSSRLQGPPRWITLYPTIKARGWHCCRRMSRIWIGLSRSFRLGCPPLNSGSLSLVSGSSALRENLERLPGRSATRRPSPHRPLPPLALIMRIGAQAAPSSPVLRPRQAELFALPITLAPSITVRCGGPAITLASISRIDVSVGGSDFSGHTCAAGDTGTAVALSSCNGHVRFRYVDDSSIRRRM